MLKLSNSNNVNIKEFQCPSAHFHSLFDESKYLIEDHTATTKDGYILTIFRIRLQQKHLSELSSKDKNNINKPVLLMHGLEDSSDGAFLNAPGKSYGFYFVDLGYDVWAGNNRGTKYCKEHVNKDITSDQFYDFSWQEMGLYDLPAFYRLILSQHQNLTTKIIYLGQSQGTTQFFVGGADNVTKKYIIGKTSRFFALSPVAYMTEIIGSTFRVLAKYNKQIYDTAEFLHIDQLLNYGCINPNNLVVQGLSLACKLFKSACNELDRITLGSPTVNDLPTILSTFITHVPSGASSRCFEHYAQLIEGGKNHAPIFRKYDFGSDLANMKHYDRTTPPDWDLSTWEIPTTLIAGALDT